MTYPIEIFRAGTHTDMNGRTLTVAVQDLEAMAAAYDPAIFAAPIVVGHPKTDDPAYGWVKSLSVDGELLIAEVDDVDPAFAEIVNEGRYRKVSASFYPPKHKANPTAAWLLKHVGFLGAQAPAVKGLKPVQFAADEDAWEFSGAAERAAGWGIAGLVGVARRLRDWLIESQGLETADKIIPASELEWAQSNAQDAINRSDQDRAVAYTENKEDPAMSHTKEELDARAAVLDTREADLASRELAFAEKESAALRRENELFLDSLIAAGKLAPAKKASTLQFMETLDHTAVVSFGEGDDATRLDHFKAMLESASPVIELKETSADDGTTVNFAENPHALADAAVDYQKAELAKGRRVDVVTAIEHVKKQKG